MVNLLNLRKTQTPELVAQVNDQLSCLSNEARAFIERAAARHFYGLPGLYLCDDTDWANNPSDEAHDYAVNRIAAAYGSWRTALIRGRGWARHVLSEILDGTADVPVDPGAQSIWYRPDGSMRFGGRRYCDERRVCPITGQRQ